MTQGSSIAGIEGSGTGPSASPERRATRLRYLRAAVVIAVASAHVALVLPASLDLGTNLEEVAGLVPVAPVWRHPDPAFDTPAPKAGTSLHFSRNMPVFAVEHGDGALFPLMVDGHIGAFPSYLDRLLVGGGSLAGAKIAATAASVLLLLGVYLLAGRLFGEGAALAAVALGAASPHWIFLHVWVRPAEHVTLLGPVFAVLAILRHRATGRFGWLCVAALLFGVAAGAKNTAAWTAMGLVGALVVLRALPRLSLARWAALVGCFSLPLLPQLVYVVLAPGDSREALLVRLRRLPAPWNAFAPERLSFFATHFWDSLVRMGTYFGPFFNLDAREPPLVNIPAGVLVVGSVVAATARGFFRGAERAARVFGLALLFLLLLYFGLYYRGQICFVLFVPWIPIAQAAVGAWLWRAAAERPRGTRRAARAALVLGGAVLLANEGVETERLLHAARSADSAVFHRGAQEALAARLRERGIARPWTTTYTLAGVLETLTDGAVRPLHAYPFFVRRCGEGRDDPRQRATDPYSPAWDELLARMGPGTHHVVLSPNATRIEINPCRDGAALAERLAARVAARGGRVVGVEHVGRNHAGGVVFDVAEVVLPAR